MIVNIDADPIETKEWLDAFDSLIRLEGKARAKFIVDQLLNQAKQQAIEIPTGMTSDYVNTIHVQDEPVYPGDLALETEIDKAIRWNAMMMVLRAGKHYPELGGHIATYASAATLYEVGFNHFFKGRSEKNLGDLVFIQGHGSPGIYARAFLEERLSATQLDYFRQEIDGQGIASYPHPYSMPKFWQFPTVSMGLGPLQAVYQARFLKYMEHRGFVKHAGRKVWCFVGDGETDEPETLAGLRLAANENLDNLIFVINCNLQRLDGPVRGGKKIVQELEGVFKGANWHVIKVLWASEWDGLFAKDQSGQLKRLLNETVDGELQKFKASDAAYVREKFFGRYPELKALIADQSDENLLNLRYGGHDAKKVYAAYAQAVQHKNQPTVILAQTVKGYGMGQVGGESMNIAHQQKKLAQEVLSAFVKRFDIKISDESLANHDYLTLEKSAQAYLKAGREKLGGFVPERHVQAEKLTAPDLKDFEVITAGSGDREISTTMAFARLLANLLKDKNLGKNIVPIVCDESRTFGMEGLFRQIGIYAPLGQSYEPEDRNQLMYYRETKDGQLIQDGINEAGAFCSWMAAATSYANHGVEMIPFYIFYSMFGFQRIADLAWAAGDMAARGFLIGSLAGKTTLAGEGLQHADDHSLIFSSVIPNCISYDPCFAYEMAVIIQAGLKRMYQNQENVFYYITAMNENYLQPLMPKNCESGIVKGMYLLEKAGKKANKVQLLGSGAILREVLRAKAILEKDYDVGADVWSVTSYTELRREALDVERYNRLHPGETAKTAYVTDCLNKNPIIATSDYMRLCADQIRSFVDVDFYSLGTDGFGRSDTRAKLRTFFEVNAENIVYTALYALFKQKKITLAKLNQAVKKLGLDPEKPNPFYH